MFCVKILIKLTEQFFQQEKSLAETAKAEMWEECGFDVPLEHFEEIQTFPSSVGTRCEPITMFYTEARLSSSYRILTSGFSFIALKLYFLK